jgi:hypothetical protein
MTLMLTLLAVLVVWIASATKLVAVLHLASSSPAFS